MLEVSGLMVKYHASDVSPAISGVSFSLEAGERVALVGANGSGKSTLLLCLAGALAPAAGTIRFTGASAGACAGAFALVMQNPDDQLFMPTVFDDAAFALRSRRCYSETDVEKKVDESLSMLHITHLKNRLTHQLSGGEKRLCAIAGALTMNPALILLDEPSSFLDPRSRRTLIAALKSLPHAMLIATHDFDLAASLCTRTLLLERGVIRADGTTLLADTALLEDCGL